MTAFNNLFEEFKRLEGQPVRIIMNDIHIIQGIVVMACEHACRVIDRCGDVVLVEYCHIDAVQEPQMRLHCKRKCFECRDRDDDDFEEFDEDECREGRREGFREGRR